MIGQWHVTFRTLLATFVTAFGVRHTVFIRYVTGLVWLFISHFSSPHFFFVLGIVDPALQPHLRQVERSSPLLVPQLEHVHMRIL